MSERLFTPAFDKKAGKWHHLSPSLIQAYKNCQRVPYFDKILGLPKKVFAWQPLGQKLHSQLEHWSKTGQDCADKRVQPLKAYVPFDPAAKVEMGLDGIEKCDRKNFPYAYHFAPTMHGIPIEGYIDRADLAKALVDDYKTTSSIRDWAKTPEQLSDDIAMLIYGKRVQDWTDAPTVFARLLYAQTKGPIDARAVLVSWGKDELLEKYAGVEELAKGLLDLPGKKQDDIPDTGRPKGFCAAYGGCSFADTCLKSPQAMLRARVLGAARNLPPSPASQEASSQQAPAGEGEETMSLLERIRAARPAGAAETPSVPPEAAKPSAPPPAPAAPQNAPDPEVQALLPRGGSVQLTPNGTKLCFDTDGNLVGQVPPKGSAGKLKIQEVTPEPTKTPEAPKPPTAEELEAVRMKGVLPPDAPASDPNAKPEEKKRGRGRPAAAQAPAKGPEAPEPDAPKGEKTPGPSTPAAGTPGVMPAGGIILFVDSIPLDGKFTDLTSYASQIAAEVAKELQVADYRLADKGAVVGKGGIAAMVRQSPPPPGVYAAFSAGFDSPINLVIEALLPMASGGARGI